MTKKYRVSIQDSIGFDRTGGEIVTCSKMRVHDSGFCILFYDSNNEVIFSFPTQLCIVTLIKE